MDSLTVSLDSLYLVLCFLRAVWMALTTWSFLGTWFLLTFLPQMLTYAFQPLARSEQIWHKLLILVHKVEPYDFFANDLWGTSRSNMWFCGICFSLGGHIRFPENFSCVSSYVFLRCSQCSWASVSRHGNRKGAASRRPNRQWLVKLWPNLLSPSPFRNRPKVMSTITQVWTDSFPPPCCVFCVCWSVRYGRPAV